MKNKVIAAVTNILICAVIAATALVGFYGGSAVTVSEHDENVFYSSRAQDAVSLMFLADGSGEDTDGVLDALKECGAKATFFIKGSWADDNTSTVRKIYSSGCEVATAGYFADDYSTLSFDSTVEDISPSVSFLKVSCGAEVSLFMPSGLSFCENTVRALCSGSNLSCAAKMSAGMTMLRKFLRTPLKICRQVILFCSVPRVQRRRLCRSL